MLNKIEAGQCIYFHRVQVTTSAAECRETESGNKLLSSKTRPCRVIKVTPATVMIDKEIIRNIVSMNQFTVALMAKNAV